MDNKEIKFCCDCKYYSESLRNGASSTCILAHIKINWHDRACVDYFKEKTQ